MPGGWLPEGLRQDACLFYKIGNLPRLEKQAMLVNTGWQAKSLHCPEQKIMVEKYHRSAKGWEEVRREFLWEIRAFKSTHVDTGALEIPQAGQACSEKI